MAKQKKRAKKSGNAKNAESNGSVQIEKYVQRHTTARFIAGALLGAYGLYLIADVVKHLNETPAWLTAFLAVFGPTGLLAGLGVLYFKYLVKKNERLNKRTDELVEKQKGAVK